MNATIILVRKRHVPNDSARCAYLSTSYLSRTPKVTNKSSKVCHKLDDTIKLHYVSDMRAILSISLREFPTVYLNFTMFCQTKSNGASIRKHIKNEHLGEVGSSSFSFLLVLTSFVKADFEGLVIAEGTSRKGKAQVLVLTSFI